MTKEEKVINYYVTCNRLKDLLRTGWLRWNVKRDRIESVAEHIYGVLMLAIAIKSEYQYDIDIMKVILMLAVHELGEAEIGDLTQFEISEREKRKKEREAVHSILKPMLDGKEIENLINEFEERKTKEAIFAFHCDKLEADIQSKLYDQEGCINMNRQRDNDIVNDSLVSDILEHTNSFSDMWLEFGQRKYHYDENFMAVSKYVQENNI